MFVWATRTKGLFCMLCTWKARHIGVIKMGLEGYLNDVKEMSIVGAVAGAALAAVVAAYPEGRELFIQQPLYVGALVFGTGAATAGLHTLAEATKYVMERAYDFGKVRTPNETIINIKSGLLLGTAYALLPFYDFYNWCKGKFYDFIGKDQYIQP